MNKPAEEKYRSSDPDSWVDRYGDILFRYALLRLRNKAAAEDIVQETFLGAIRNQKSFNHQSSEQNWIFGILKHKIIDHFRKSTREQPTGDPERDATYNSSDFNEKGMWIKGPAEWKQNPTDQLEQKEFQKVFDYCIKKLPKRTADAFLFREIDGLKGEEICQVLNITPNNYWVLLHRARLQLRSCLESAWTGGEPK